jgi:predicted transcriptional regulator
VSQDDESPPFGRTLARSDHLQMFHRVSSLLSPDEPLVVNPECSVSDALKLMKLHDFSQIPVVSGVEVLGLFSHRSLSEKLVGGPRLLTKVNDPESLVVDDFLEQPVYVRASDAIDSLFEPLEDADVVLVGDPDRLLGIVTSSDVISYLYRVASPYMLLKEIEEGLRALIDSAVTPDQLAECARNSLASLYRGREEQLPTKLKDMTFDEQISIIVANKNWPLFSDVMGTSRNMFNYELRPVGSIRNDAFHFKKELSEEDLEKLASARSWILRKLRRKAGQGQ